MKFTHSIGIGWLAVAAMGLAATGVAHAQNLADTRPLRIIVITSPGGQGDAVARILAEGLSRSLRRPVLVENKPGAGGNIATEYVAQQPADGTVLLLTSNNHTINPTLFSKVNYDYQKSLEPVTQLTRSPTVIAAHPGFKAKDLKELVATSRAGEVSYGTGIGSAGHFTMEMLRKETGHKIVFVPYKGAGPAVADTLGGQIQLTAGSLTSAIQHIKGGRLAGFAVSSDKRWPGAEEIPTLKELGCAQCVYETYLGLFAPKGTSAAYVKTLNEYVAAVLGESSNRAKLAGLGAEAVVSTPEQFSAMLKADFDKAARVIRETGMRAE